MNLIQVIGSVTTMVSELILMHIDNTANNYDFVFINRNTTVNKNL